MTEKKDLREQEETESAAGIDRSGLPPADLSRAELVWAVIAFQLKLVADGLRDVLLSPLSIVAGILGFIEGGQTPGRYFRKVIELGRRTERWINLFGSHQQDTADDLLRPIEKRFHEEIAQQLPQQPERPGQQQAPSSEAVQEPDDRGGGRREQS
ncbi:MAG: hypothetical protein AAGG11_03460 [Pseudomonadota bacterium]